MEFSNRYRIMTFGVMVQSLFIGMLLFGYSANAASITISCGFTNDWPDLCKEGVERWNKENGDAQDAQVASTNERPKTRFEHFLDIFDSDKYDSENDQEYEGATIDIVEIDLVWVGAFKDHLVDLSEYLDEETLNSLNQNVMKNNKIDGSIYAVPWYYDGGLLYYRKDLLNKYDMPVPKTWRELYKTAKEITEREESNDLYGYTFQGADYEGLTCNAIEWIGSFGGGNIVNDEGEIDINNRRSKDALNFMRRMINEISNENNLNYTERESLNDFKNGKAVFMRNWPYAWRMLNRDDSNVKNLIGVAKLPGGSASGSASTVGGWQLAISKYSGQIELAADLIDHLLSQKEQEIRVTEGSYIPSLKGFPLGENFGSSLSSESTSTLFHDAVLRPANKFGQNYNSASAIFSSEIHRFLHNNQSAQETIENVEDGLRELLDEMSMSAADR